MLKILVLTLLVLNLLENIQVSGNPLTLIPIQKCPQNCNQNCGQNYQNPQNQVILQPNSVQQIPAAIIQQPTNNQLYPQTYTIQNQLSTPYQSQDPVNQLNQLYLNKILSNPTIQNILDPANLYSQCGIDIPTQVYKIPNNTPNTPCNQQTPHVVNNYFILPPEYFDKNVKGTKHPNPQRRERDGNRKVNNSSEGRRPRHGSDEIIIPIKRRQPKNQNADDLRRDNQRRSKTNDDARENKHSAEDCERNTRRRKPDDKQDTENDCDRNTSIPNRRRGQQQGCRDANRPQERERSHKNTQRTDQVVRVKPKHSEKSSETVERVPKTKKSRDDTVIEEFQKKFPAVPEEVVRKLLSYLRTQLRKRQPFYHSNDKPISARVTLKPQKPETTTNVAPPTVTTTTEPAKTTEAARVKSTAPIKCHKCPTTTPNAGDEQETTTKFTMPESGTEDVESDVKIGIIDDYYPGFIDDHKYYDSAEAFNVRNHRDNRYYYTTDRNYEPTPSVHEYYMKKLKNIHKALEDSFEDVLSKPDVVDTKHEPEYRKPTQLDTADFKTKQMVRHRPKSDQTNEIEKEISYKSSTYSDVKTPPSNEVKNYKINGSSKKVVPDSIETVYAHTKVVKYGKNNNESGENDIPVVTYYLPDNMQYEDNGKTVIIAKSIPAEHFW